MSFDSECDIAALVFGPEDDPDHLLIDFASDLRESGILPAGCIQIGRRCQSQIPRLSVTVLPDGDIDSLVPLNSHKIRNDGHLEIDGLDRLQLRVSDAIRTGADIVIINRFGRREAAGTGLSALFRQAADAGIPVLVAVPESRFTAWISFCDGMSVRLRCERSAVDQWWLSVRLQKPFGNTISRERFCELAK